MADPKIKIRRSATPNKVPSKDQLQLGELAINTYDGKLYLEQDQGGVGVGNTVIAVNPWSVGVGSTAYNTHFTAGKAGIGTTSAQYNLDVGGDINFTGNLYQDGSAFTSGVGIRTAGGTVGWAATIIDFRGPGVTTAYYSSSTGIGTVYFQGGGGGGGNASVTVSDSAPSSPSNGDLWFKSDVGELYLWYTDGSSNQWVEASGGSNTVVTSDTAPSSPQDGDLWWNSDTGELKVYYNDGNSSQWVDANSEGGFIQYWTQTNTNGNLGVTTTGYVGIGTTTATDALTVVGAADIDGNLIVSGVSTFSDHVNLPDDKIIKLGNSDDFQMYHQSSSTEGTYITNSAGQLTFKNTAANQHTYIHGDRVHLRSTTGNETYLTANHNGQVDLYYDNTKRFETTNTGASVTGDLAASGNVTGVAATFTGNVTVEGVLTYEDVKNVDAIGIVTARKGIKALAGGANIVDGTTTDNLNVTGITTFAGITTSTGTIFGKQLSISGISTLKNTVVGGATTELIVHGDARVTGVLSVGQGSLSINERDIYAVGVVTGSNFKTGTTNVHSAGVEVAGVNVLGADTPVGLGATVYNSGLIVGKQGAEFQGVVTASSFHGSGADLTDVISGVGIGTEGGVVGYAATIIHFKGAGVTTAYYSSATGIGTINFHSATTGGGGANVTVSDTPPGSPSAGDLWWESDIGELKIYYSDGDSAQWVDASGADSLVQIGTSAPTGAVSGDLWFNSETGDFMVYYTDTNSSAWVSVNAVNDNVLWKTNATGIHTTSNVGIGTTTATDPLTVVGAADIDGRLIVSGITTFGSHVYHGDNDHAIFGDGSDLSIYHNGSHSYIKDTGTGSLKVLTNLLHVRNTSDNSTLAKFTTNGANELYFSSNKKFETTNTGVSITGNNVVSGNVTAVDGTLSGDLDVDGHTNLDNVSIAGVTTFANTARFSGDVNIVGTLTYEDVRNVDSVGIATARQGLRITGGGLDVVGVSTFANNIDANGSLDVAGDVSIADKIVHTGDTNTLIRFPSAGTIQFDTDGDERLRITDSGYLGIKRSTPLANLHTTNNELAIGANPASAAAPNATYDGLVVDGSAGTWINIRSRGDGNVAYGRLAFSDDTRGRGHIEYRHKDGSGDDWMGFQTAGSERLRIDSAGRVLIGTTTEGATQAGNVTVSGTGNVGMTFRSTDSGTNRIFFSDATSGAGEYAGFINYDHSSNLMLFGTNETTRLRIDSAGRVLIGTASADDTSQKLKLHQAGNDHCLLNLNVSNSSYSSLINFGDSGSWSIGQIAYAHSDDSLRFKVNAAERLRIDSNGNLGLGDDGPTNFTNYTNLSIHGSSGGAITFGDDGTDEWEIYGGDGAVRIYDRANTTERLRITDDGYLLLGTTDTGFSSSYTNMTIGNTSTSNTGLTIASSASNGYSRLHFADGNSGAARYAGWIAYSHSGDEMLFSTNNSGSFKVIIDSSGRVGFGGLTPSNYYGTYDDFVWGSTSGSVGMTIVSGTDSAGYITWADGTSGADQYRGRIFYSHSNDSFNFRCNGLTTNILTINSSALLVGKTTTSQTSDNGLIINNNGNISYAQDGSGNHDFAEFYRGTSGSYSRVGYIRTNGSSTTYSTSSDYRLKENEVLISDGIARLKTLKPYRFNFKEDSSTTVDGFFAHEVESAVPEAVSGEKDGEEMQGMDYGRITPLLTAALQEAIAKIETLEAEVAALKSS